MLSLGDEFALALQASRRTTYKTLRGAVTALPVNEFEKKAALYLMKDMQRGMLGVGDDGVRKVLGIPQGLPGDLSKAPDFLSVSKSGGLVLSEAKGVVSENGEAAVAAAVKQLNNALTKLVNLNLAGDVERAEIIIPKGVKLPGSYGIKDGYLIIVKNGITTTVQIGEGLKNFFVKVVQI